MKRFFFISLLITISSTLPACADLDLKTRDQLRGPAKEASPPPPEKQEATDTELRQFNGRIEELENQLHQATLTTQANKDEVSKQKQADEQKISALEEELKKLEAQVQVLNEQVNKPKAVAPADPGTFIADGDDLTANKKHKEAIVAYQKYRDALPKGNRYPEATYKIGTCFQELGMKDEAKAFFEEVTSKFPRSPFAKTALKKLKSLK